MRKGILLLGGMGKRFLPTTSIINKHLIPIIDRPMFHYSLSTLVLCGITTINIVSDEKTLSLIKNLMGNGNQMGLDLSYTIQKEAGGIHEGIILNKKFIVNWRNFYDEIKIIEVLNFWELMFGSTLFIFLTFYYIV